MIVFEEISDRFEQGKIRSLAEYRKACIQEAKRYRKSNEESMKALIRVCETSEQKRMEKSQDHSS